MVACIGRNYSPLFKLITHNIFVFDEVYILFHFNIILKHNGMSFTKINRLGSQVHICILVHLVGFLKPRITMHGTTYIKFIDAKQAKVIFQFKNIKK